MDSLTAIVGFGFLLVLAEMNHLANRIVAALNEVSARLDSESDQLKNLQSELHSIGRDKHSSPWGASSA